MFEYNEDIDPVEQSKKVGRAFAAARHEADNKGIKAFLFHSSSPEEFDERINVQGVREILDDVASKYLNEVSDGRQKLAKSLKKEYVTKTSAPLGKPGGPMHPILNRIHREPGRSTSTTGRKSKQTKSAPVVGTSAPPHGTVGTSAPPPGTVGTSAPPPGTGGYQPPIRPPSPTETGDYEVPNPSVTKGPGKKSHIDKEQAVKEIIAKIAALRQASSASNVEIGAALGISGKPKPKKKPKKQWKDPKDDENQGTVEKKPKKQWKDPKDDENQGTVE